MNDPFRMFNVIKLSIQILDQGNTVLFQQDYSLRILRGTTIKNHRFPIFTNNNKPQALTDFTVNVEITQTSGMADKLYLHTWAKQNEQLY